MFSLFLHVVHCVFIEVSKKQKEMNTYEQTTMNMKRHDKQLQSIVFLSSLLLAEDYCMVKTMACMPVG